MNNAMALAALWKRNKAVNDEWVSDYCSRTGSTHEDVIANRKASWVRDNTAESLGTHQGYELSVIQNGNKSWRYAVVTPWGMSEGLGDLPSRDDDAAVTYLMDVIKEMEALPEKNDQKPKTKKKTPAAAAESSSSTSDRPAKAKENEPSKPATRRRGRPKGSKDSRPRKRRTMAEVVESERKSEREETDGGLTLSDNVAWIADGSGYYRSHEIWLGGDWPQVKLNGKLVNLPDNALVWKRGPKPDMLRRWEQGIEKSWLPDVD